MWPCALLSKLSAVSVTQGGCACTTCTLQCVTLAFLILLRVEGASYFLLSSYCDRRHRIIITIDTVVQQTALSAGEDDSWSLTTLLLRFLPQGVAVVL